MATSMKKKGTAASTKTKEVATPPDIKKEVVQSKKAQKEKKVFQETDGILCRSVTEGGLFFVGKKTGMLYQWNEYGAEYEVEYRDLVIAVRTRSDFIFTPYFIIEDEDFIEEFPVVKKFYDESYDVTEIKSILYLPFEDMKRAVTALPKGALKTLETMVSTEVSNKNLDSVQKIRYFDEIFGTELLLLTEFED